MWNPVTWAYFMCKMDYLTMFYEQMSIHLTMSLDINPGKFAIDTSDESQYLNKGRMQALLFAIYNFDWEVFVYGWN